MSFEDFTQDERAKISDIQVLALQVYQKGMIDTDMYIKIILSLQEETKLWLMDGTIQQHFVRVLEKNKNRQNVKMNKKV